MKNPILVDFHCHLDLYPDFESIIEESERRGVRTLAVTTTPRAWPRNRDLTKKTKYVRSALGLHPQLVGESSNQELVLWEKYLPETRYIGEVGLDAGPRFFHTFQQQIHIFKRILQCCAATGDRILSIHSVRSVSSVLDLISENLPPDKGKVVLHWFTGSAEEADRAVKLGCYFSINTEMVQRPKGRRLIEKLPLERIITETDGPFTKLQTGITKPWDVEKVVEMIAMARGTTSDQISKAIVKNMKTLLR